MDCFKAEDLTDRSPSPELHIPFSDEVGSTSATANKANSSNNANKGKKQDEEEEEY